VIDWSDVVDGLGNALAVIPGLRFYGYPVERIEPPACAISPPELQPLTVNDASFQYNFPLWVMVGKADAKAAYNELVPYTMPGGPRSIRTALYTDITLGGAVDSTVVLNVVPQIVSFAGTDFYAAEFTVEVIG